MKNVTPSTAVLRKPASRLAKLRKRFYVFATAGLAVLAVVIFFRESNVLQAQGGPNMLVPNLRVRTVVSGLLTPISIAWIGPTDFLVLEKNTGRMQRVVNGTVTATVLDLELRLYGQSYKFLPYSRSPSRSRITWLPG